MILILSYEPYHGKICYSFYHVSHVAEKSCVTHHMSHVMEKYMILGLSYEPCHGKRCDTHFII